MGVTESGGQSGKEGRNAFAHVHDLAVGRASQIKKSKIYNRHSSILPWNEAADPEAVLIDD
jgi:hypothetical protein